MSLKMLRWIGVIVPAATIATFEYVIHFPFHLPVGPMYGLTVGVVILIAFLFSNHAFHRLERSQRELARRNDELSALNVVGRALSGPEALEEVFDRALGKVLEVTETQAGEIFLLDEVTGDLSLKALKGEGREAFLEKTTYKLGEGIPGRVALTGDPILIDDVGQDPRFLRKGVVDAGFRAFACLPIRSKNRVIGVITLAAFLRAKIVEDDLALLSAMGNVIGMAIENAKLYQELKQMSLLREREGIARDVHDGLAQTLGVIYLKMGDLESSLKGRLGEEDGSRVVELKKLVGSAYEEVRQFILGLRTLVAKRLGLVPSLTEYLHEFSELHGIKVELVIDPELHPVFSPRVEAPALRIIQEALTNVRKHASATRAVVSLNVDGGNGLLMVEDDGVGFEPDKLSESPMRFGLRTMRERAEGVGGTLIVTSAPGKGTRVVARLPISDGGAGESHG